MVLCPVCDKELKSIHALVAHKWRAHTKNGMLHKPFKDVISWNKGKTKETDARVAKNARSISIARKTLPQIGCCTKAWLSSEEHRLSSARGGGYKPNAGRTKKFHILDSFGNPVCLQSTYELTMSDILKTLSINWIRPKAIKYGNRNYFADFYLTDKDMYLDTKNDYLIKIDAEKINLVRETGVKLLIISKSDLTVYRINLLVNGEATATPDKCVVEGAVPSTSTNRGLT